VSQKLAEADSVRPEVVGRTLNEVARKDPEILQTVIEVMETDKLLKSGARVDVLSEGASVIVELGEPPARSAVPRSRGGEEPPGTGISTDSRAP
jgi:hypothetical protein